MPGIAGGTRGLLLCASFPKRQTTREYILIQERDSLCRRRIGLVLFPPTALRHKHVLLLSPLHAAGGTKQSVHPFQSLTSLRP